MDDDDDDDDEEYDVSSSECLLYDDDQADSVHIQDGPKKRTPEKQYGCPLFWTTM